MKAAIHLGGNPPTPPLACGSNSTVSSFPGGLGRRGRRARALNRWRQAGARPELGRERRRKNQDRFLELFLLAKKKHWSCSHTTQEGPAAVASAIKLQGQRVHQQEHRLRGAQVIVRHHAETDLEPEARDQARFYD